MAPGAPLLLLAAGTVTAEELAWAHQREQLRKEWKQIRGMGADLVRQEPVVGPDSVVGRGAQGVQEPGIGICVTGQMARLEVESKVRSITSALNGLNIPIDLVFVVSKTGARFVNADKYYPENSANFSSNLPSWTMSSLEKRTRTLGPVRSLVIDTSPQWELPYLRPDYLRGLKRNAVARAQSHVRQWRALWCCFTHFGNLARKHGSPYTSLVKLRDDTLVLGPLSAAVNASVHQNQIIVPACNNFKGHNDKVAIVGASQAERYFIEPLWMYFFANTRLPGYMSPERYMRWVLEYHNVTVEHAKLPTLTLIPGQDLDGKKLCIPLMEKTLGKTAECVSETCEVLEQISNRACVNVRSADIESALRDAILKRCGEG